MPTVTSLRGALVCPVLLAAFLFSNCEVDPDTTTTRRLNDQNAVLLTLDTWRTGIESGQLQFAMDLAADDYLHQGRIKADFSNWATSLSEYQDCRINLAQTVIQFEGDDASVDYLLNIQSCDEENCWTVLQCKSSDTVACGWLHRLRRLGNGWIFVGDQSPWGLDFSLQATETGIYLTGSVHDPSRDLVDVRAQWAEVGEDLGLEKLTGDYWLLPDGTAVPGELYPNHPLPWELEVTLVGPTSTDLSSKRFTAFLDNFATDLLPSGETVEPVVFSWVTPEAGDGGVRLEVLSEGQVLWRSGRTWEESLPYAGPPLTPGQGHEYRVQVFDTTGASSIARGGFTALSAESVTPNPTSISPQTGSRVGGEELAITGSGFLPGARVLLGIAECLETQVVDEGLIECTAPALEPGIYNVLVANPSGRIGMIERGFLVP